MKLPLILSLLVVCLWICPCLPQVLKNKVPVKGLPQEFIWDLKNCEKIRSGLEKHLFMHLNGTFTQLRLRDAFPVLMRLLLPLNCTRQADTATRPNPPPVLVDGEPASVVDEPPAYDSRPKRQVFMGPWMFGLPPFLGPAPFMKEPGEPFPPFPQGRSPFKDITDRPGGLFNLFNPMLGMMAGEMNTNNPEVAGSGVDPMARTLGMMSMAQMMGLAGQQQRRLFQQQQWQRRQPQQQQQQQQPQQQQQQPQLQPLQQPGQYRTKRAANAEGRMRLDPAPSQPETPKPSLAGDVLWVTPEQPSPSARLDPKTPKPWLGPVFRTTLGDYSDNQFPPMFGWPRFSRHHASNTATTLDGGLSAPAPIQPLTLPASAAPWSKAWAAVERALVQAEDPKARTSSSASGAAEGGERRTSNMGGGGSGGSGGPAAHVRVRRASEESSSDKILTEIVQLGDLTFPADTFVKAVEYGLFSDVERSKSEK